MPGRWALGILMWTVFLTLSVASPVTGQEWRSTAARMRSQIFRTDVQPQWLPDGYRFWYRVRTGRSQHEFVLIDGRTGERTSGPTAAALNVVELQETRVSTIDPPVSRRSTSGGAACELTFINRLDAPVQLHWLNLAGERIAYGTIAPGAAREQSTYVGHVWQITNSQDEPIARLTASLAPSHIVIDGPQAEEPLEPERSPPRETRAAGGRSPDGRWRARHQGTRVTVESAETGEAVEIVAALDADMRYAGAIQWSPTSAAFVIAAGAPVEERKVTIVESSPADQLQPKQREFRYAKPGDPLPQPVPVLFRLVEGQFQPVIVDRAWFPNQFNPGGELTVRWSADGREFYFNYNERGHQRYRILAVDAATAAVRVVAEETSRTFIETRKKGWRHWLAGGAELLWLSEADGWSHLWKVDIAGRQSPQQLTSGPWTVREVLHVDDGSGADSSGTIWFLASGLNPGEDPYHLHLCRVQIDGSGFRQLTEGDGTHAIEFSPDRSLFIDTWSRVDLPPVVELRRSTDGELVCEVERGDAALFNETGGRWPERFVAKGRDGVTDIYGVIYRPTKFDPAKQYPVVEQVYAGPHGAFVPHEFADGTSRQDLADLGFIVVQADGMGTNYRGKAFHDVCWKNLKDAGFPDRIAWIKAAAQTRPWMDLSRVGIFGGSAGGQSAMRALLDHSDFYHVAVADCGCHDNRMDKIWWNEQWMGWPVDESYARSSNAEDAARLQGHLLLIVGELDRNVDPASTYQVVAALQKAGKPFEYMPIIGAGHGAVETPYGSRLRREFLIRHLRPETPE